MTAITVVAYLLLYVLCIGVFMTEVEFKQSDDDAFRLYMIKRILRYYNKKLIADHRPNYQDILNRRKIRMDNLTDDERNISPELTDEDLYVYLSI